MMRLKTIQHNLVDYIITDKESNFVVLGQGRFSKIYLLALRNETKNVPESYVAFKVQRDDYPNLGNIANPHIDKMWQDEHQNLLALAGDANIIHMKHVFKLSEEETVSSDEESAYPLVFVPLCYCKMRKKFFHLPCPDSGQPLENFKIENYYESSVDRYIYSPQQQADKRGKVTIYCKAPAQEDLLFHMDAKYENVLNAGPINEHLRKKVMKELSQAPSPNSRVEVQKPGRKWLIFDDTNKKQYFILKEKGRSSLDFYQSNIVLPENCELLYQSDLLESLSRQRLRQASMTQENNVSVPIAGSASEDAEDVITEEFSEISEEGEIIEADEDGDASEELLVASETTQVPAMSPRVPCLQCTFGNDNFGCCEHFKVFSFYEFYAIPLEVCHFPVVPFIHLLSQRKMDDIRKELLLDHWYFANMFPREERLFSFKKNEEKRVLEVLYYKLMLFLDICAAVGNVHRRTKKAHMHLLPKNLMVRVFADSLGSEQGDAEAYLPPLDRGSFRVTLIDIAGLSQHQSKINVPPVPNHNLLDSSIESDSLKNILVDIDKPFSVSSRKGSISFQDERFSLTSRACNFKSENYQPGDWISWKEEKSTQMEWGQVDKVSDNEIGGSVWRTEVKKARQTALIRKAKETLQDSQISKLHDSQISKLQDSQISKLHDSQISKMYESQIGKKMPANVDLADTNIIDLSLIQKVPTGKNIPVSFKHYPGYGPHHDLYGLGKLFIYLLFATQKVKMEDIDNSIDSFLKYHGLKEDASVAEIERKIFDHIDKDAVFRWGNLVYEGGDTVTQYHKIWEATIRLIFQIITTKFKNFSIAQQDITGDNLMTEIGKQVRALMDNINELLFSTVKFYDQNRKYEIELNNLREQKQMLEEMLQKYNELPLWQIIKQKIEKRFGHDQ